MLNLNIPFDGIAKIAPVFPRNGAKSMTLSNCVSWCDADIILNGGTFAFGTYTLDSGLKADGKYLCRREQYGLGVTGSKIEWSYGGTWSPTWFGMYRTGWYKGRVQGTPIGDKRGRAMMGYIGDTLRLIWLEDGTKEASPTTKAFQTYFADADAAINLDGGGSVQYHTPIQHHSTGRALPYFIGIWLTPDARRRLFEGDAYRVSVKSGSSLRIRKTASAFGAVVGIYKRGDIVHVTERKGNWGHTEKGWCSMQYLERVASSVVCNVFSWLSVRSKPAMSGYTEIGRLHSGDVVQVVGTRGNYAKIIYGGGYGYVTRAYLRRA